MLFMTLGSFLLLIVGIFASIYLYFDRLYEPQKINHMIDAINEFTEGFVEDQWTDEQLYSEVSKFMKNQNATLSILPGASIRVAAYSAVPTLEASQQPDFYVLHNQLINHPLQKDFRISPPWKERPFSVLNLALNESGIMIDSSYHRTTPYSAGTTTIIDGDLVLYPVAISRAISVSSSLDFGTKNGVTYTISSLPYTDYKQVSFTKQSTLKNGEVKTTNVNLSLQSVDEVMNFILRFFPYLLAATLLLSILMAILYSRTISKPIVNITNIANRMASMELGISSEVLRRDELGDLSVSLNTLSSNLQKALGDLNHAHEQLKADYEHELRQEKARKEFVANVSHELKTPLGIIKGFSEGIRDGVKAEKKEYYIDVILEEITRMDEMILEMLEISKFDAGAITYRKKEMDVKRLIENTIRIFGHRAEDKQVTFTVQGEFDLCIADEPKIERVLNNLIGNAVSYCNPDSLITIRGSKKEDSLNISIENDCLLMSEEVLGKVWDRFYKADTSHNRDKEGTGLGLAITKSILEGHGCNYGVANTERGVRFYFELETVR
jgi:signal transduction histidine kinase